MIFWRWTESKGEWIAGAPLHEMYAQSSAILDKVYKLHHPWMLFLGKWADVNHSTAVSTHFWLNARECIGNGVFETYLQPVMKCPHLLGKTTTKQSIQCAFSARRQLLGTTQLSDQLCWVAEDVLLSLLFSCFPFVPWIQLMFKVHGNRYHSLFLWLGTPREQLARWAWVSSWWLEMERNS